MMKRVLTAIMGVLMAAGILSACTSVPEEDTPTPTPTIPPVAEVASVDEMSEKLDFEMQTFQAPGYAPARYEILDGELGQITYENDKNFTLKLRMQKVNDDISDIEDVEDGGMNDVGRSKIWFGYKDDVSIAQWGQDGYTYCLIGDGMNRTYFTRMTILLESQINPEKTDKK